MQKKDKQLLMNHPARETHQWIDEALALIEHPDYRIKGLAESALNKLLEGDDITAEKWFGFARSHLMGL